MSTANTGGQDWSAERIERLTTQDIEQLRANAERLGEAAVLTLCEQALKARPVEKHGERLSGHALGRHLISRSKAFQARGVFLAPGGGSWSGVRKSDGKV